MRNKRQLTAFGIEVKKRLIDRNMTQTELAEQIGIKKQYLTMILCGERANSKYVEQIKSILELRI